jgi:hypothetical protein
MTATTKVAIITGASQGIGAGLVAGFRGAGYAVVGNSRSIGSVEERDYLTVEGDIAEAETARRVFDRALDRFGRIELLECRERKLPLGLVAHRPQHLEPLRRADGVLQQRRLADARLTVDHERSAMAVPRPDQQSVENLGLTPPPEQHRPQIASSPGSLANRPHDCGFPGCAPRARL